MHFVQEIHKQFTLYCCNCNHLVPGRKVSIQLHVCPRSPRQSGRPVRPQLAASLLQYQSVIYIRHESSSLSASLNAAYLLNLQQATNSEERGGHRPRIIMWSPKTSRNASKLTLAVWAIAESSWKTLYSLSPYVRSVKNGLRMLFTCLAALTPSS
jgi:hypothetical protein